MIAELHALTTSIDDKRHATLYSHCIGAYGVEAAPSSVYEQRCTVFIFEHRSTAGLSLTAEVIMIRGSDDINVCPLQLRYSRGAENIDYPLRSFHIDRLYDSGL